MVILTTKLTLPEALEILGVDKQWLLEQTGLSVGVIDRNLDYESGTLKTHITSAAAISQALGMTVEEIDWPRGLSYNGRNALVADPEMTMTLTVTVKPPPVAVCLGCYMALPATMVCGTCEE